MLLGVKSPPETSKKGACCQVGVGRVDSGHFLVDVLFFGARPKKQLHCFCAFGMEIVYFLQRAEERVNTNVFARCCPKNTVNNVVFATSCKKLVNTVVLGCFRLPKCQKHKDLECFLLPEAQKNVKTRAYLTILGHYKIAEKTSGQKKDKKKKKKKKNNNNNNNKEKGHFGQQLQHLGHRCVRSPTIK